MVFPALFSAGMALIDTADSILMVGAYGWAFIPPVRKLYYNEVVGWDGGDREGVSRRSDSSAGICGQPARSIGLPARSPAIPQRSGSVSPQCFCSAGWFRSRSTHSGGTRPLDVMVSESAGRAEARPAHGHFSERASSPLNYER